MEESLVFQPLGRGGGSLVLPAASSDGNVPQGPSFGPVSSAAFAEVSRLGEAIVVVVAELGVGGIASRAAKGLLLLRARFSLLLQRSRVRVRENFFQ